MPQGACELVDLHPQGCSVGVLEIHHGRSGGCRTVGRSRGRAVQRSGGRPGGRAGVQGCSKIGTLEFGARTSAETWAPKFRQISAGHRPNSTKHLGPGRPKLARRTPRPRPAACIAGPPAAAHPSGVRQAAAQAARQRRVSVGSRALPCRPPMRRDPPQVPGCTLRRRAPATFGQIWLGIGAEIDETWPEIGQFRPNTSQIRPSLARNHPNICTSTRSSWSWMRMMMPFASTRSSWP